jgi:hypothetical protein
MTMRTRTLFWLIGLIVLAAAAWNTYLTLWH